MDGDTILYAICKSPPLESLSLFTCPSAAGARSAEVPASLTLRSDGPMICFSKSVGSHTKQEREHESLAIFSPQIPRKDGIC